MDTANSSATKVAIIGMACHVPNANSPSQFWENIRQGIDNRVQYSDDDLRAAGAPESLINNPDYVKYGMPLAGFDEFDFAFFGLSHREASLMDPQHRHFLECCWEALESAGYAGRNRGDVGVFGGSGHNAYMPYNLLTNQDLMANTDLFYLRHLSNDKDFLTTRVSYCLDLKGPSVNVQTACSTSLVAIHLACQSLLNGECDMALAGGVTIELPHKQGYLYREGEVLSPDGRCRAFDIESNGTIFGSGAGVVLLKLLDDAIEDGDPIQAVILSSAINNDGSEKAGYMAPGVEGQAKVIREAIQLANIEIESIQFVETHGTGTAIGDPIEFEALNEVFSEATDRRNFCSISSLKPNIGHLDTAAGVLSLVKATMALQNREIPSLLHHVRASPECDFDNSPFRVHGEWVAWDSTGPRRAGVSSLGVGGTNAHIILEEPPQQELQRIQRGTVPLSARTSEELTAQKHALAAYLEKNAHLSVADIAASHRSGRRAFRFREAFRAGNVAELREQLTRAPDTNRSFDSAKGNRKLAFCFAGGGSQRPGMARALAEEYPTFAHHLDSALSFVPRPLNDKLRALLLGDSLSDNAEDEFKQPSLSVPGIFLTQYALGKTLIDEFQLHPDALLGHSLGDYAACTLADVFTLRDAVDLVVLRGSLIESIDNAAMTSVMASLEESRKLTSTGAELASVNAPNLCVLSGTREQIEKVEELCLELDLSAKRVPLNAAAHCSLLDPILQPYRERLESCDLRPPNLRVMCHHTGKWLTANESTSADYWVRHLRQTVDFLKGLSSIKEEAEYAFLEVGVGATLTNFVNQCSEIGNTAATLTTLDLNKQQSGENDGLRQVIADLWSAGYNLDWQILGDPSGRIIPLPTYAFNHQVCWINPTPGAHLYLQAGLVDNSRGSLDKWLYTTAWTSQELGPIPENRPELLVFDDGSPELVHLCEKADRIAGHQTLRYRLIDVIESLSTSAESTFNESISKAISVAGERGLHILYSWPRAQFERDSHYLPFYGILDLIKAIAQSDSEFPIELTVLVEGQYSIGGEAIGDPLQSMAIGVSRVAASEVPMLRTQIIDTGLSAPNWLLEKKADLILRACFGLRDSKDPWRTIALREGQALFPHYIPINRDHFPDRIESDATYIISGGTGYVAQRLARALVAKYHCHVLLLVRPGRANAVPVHNLEKLHVVEFDQGNLVKMRDILASFGADNAPIRGLFHTAGRVQDELIQLSTKEAISSVLAPKIAMTQALDDCLEGQALDFIVLFSSMSVDQGLEGQAAYSAANAFMDTFALKQRYIGKPYLSVAWTAWENAASKSDGREPYEHPIFHAHRISGGRESFYFLASADRLWMLDEHRNLKGDVILPGTGYISLATIAYQTRFNTRFPLIIEDVTFIELCGLKEGMKKHVAIHVTKGNGEWCDIAITNVDETTEYARMRIRVGNSNDAPQVDVVELRKRCAPDNPQLLVDTYMQFGPRWNNVAGVMTNSDTAIVDLALPNAFHEDLKTYPLHPAMLDVAIAGAQKIAGFDPLKDFLVPFSYDRLTCFEPLSPQITALVTLREKSEYFAKFDVQITNADGQVLINVDNFSMRRLDPSAISGLQIEVDENELELGIAPEDGIQQTLSLTNDMSVPRIIVSPYSPQELVRNCMAQASQEAGATESELTQRPQMSTAYVEVESDIGQRISNIWSSALGVLPIGVDDDFFELGGHSLLLTRVSSITQKELQKRVSLEDLFSAPTIRNWCAVFGSSDAADSSQVLRSVKRVSRGNYLSES